MLKCHTAINELYVQVKIGAARMDAQMSHSN